MSQSSVTQCLAKLNDLETDLLTALLLHSFTRQPFLNYSCEVHQTNNANTLILNHSMSVLTTQPDTLFIRVDWEHWGGGSVCHSWPWCYSQTHRQFGLMTHQRIWRLKCSQKSGTKDGVTSVWLFCSAGPWSVSGSGHPEPAGQPWQDWPSCSECPIPSRTRRPVTCWGNPHN